MEKWEGLKIIPNMTVIIAADYPSTQKLIKQSAKIGGPVYLRFTQSDVPIIYKENEEFIIGKAKKLKEGNEVAIIANGNTVHLALEAAETLESKGVSVKLLDMHTVRPIDREAILECMKVGKVVTVEDHSMINGLGSFIGDVVTKQGTGRISRIGLCEQFNQPALSKKQLRFNKDMVESIVETAKEML